MVVPLFKKSYGNKTNRKGGQSKKGKRGENKGPYWRVLFDGSVFGNKVQQEKLPSALTFSVYNLKRYSEVSDLYPL